MHVDGKVDPEGDMETINTELILADLQTLEKALVALREGAPPQARRAARARDGRGRARRRSQRGEAALGLRRSTSSRSASSACSPPSPSSTSSTSTRSILTDDAKKAELAALVAPAEAVFLDAKIESELIDLDPEDAAELLASTGQDESGLDQLARIGFETLGLQTYLTAGPKETRAWTIGKGWKAPQAAGVIHTDFEKGFIKAEVISFDDLVETGSIAEARSAGKARIEGKDYVMQDGDVVEFRFNN